MSSNAIGIDRKYLIWGSLFAVGGAAALTYMLYTKDKDHLYKELEHPEDDEADSAAEEDDEDERMVRDKDILIVGLEGAGKSSILASISGNQQQKFQPTDGFNVVSFLDSHGARLNLVELGGAKKNHQYWRHFYTKKNMVVMVIDASSQHTLPQCQFLLKELLGEENLKGLPFIIVANKQDTSGSIDGDDLMRELKLSTLDPVLRKRNIYHVQTQTPAHGVHKGVSELKNLMSSCK